jgi:hypothetical protein
MRTSGRAEAVGGLARRQALLALERHFSTAVGAPTFGHVSCEGSELKRGFLLEERHRGQLEWHRIATLL